MITSKNIDAMEERLLRMSPYVDVMTVNVLRREIKFLRDLVDEPNTVVSLKKEKKAKLLEQIPTEDILPTKGKTASE